MDSPTPRPSAPDPRRHGRQPTPTDPVSWADTRLLRTLRLLHLRVTRDSDPRAMADGPDGTRTLTVQTMAPFSGTCTLCTQVDPSPEAHVQRRTAVQVTLQGRLIPSQEPL